MVYSTRSLVCDNCWTGPFSQQSFREIVNGQEFVCATTWGRVQHAADRGCGLCSLLIDDKEDNKDDVSFRLQFATARTATPTSSEFRANTIVLLRAQCLKVEVEGYEIDIDNNVYFLYTTADDPAAPEIVAREPVRDVGAPRGFSLAMECLQDCISNHQTCPKVNLDTHLPTRTIDCSDPSHPRLFIGQDVIMPYVALSYVWGGLQPNSTTTKNIEAYTAGIDIELVPKTIQDAIQATNKFGLRYLWVDSFCIIQDSADDKKKELTQMSRIFHDAYFTPRRVRIRWLAPQLSPTREATAASPILVSRRSPTQPMFTTYNASGEPVTKRAWCLEERLLSARKFVYASDTLHYHCQSAVTSIGDALSGPRNAEKLPDLMFMPGTAVGTSWVHGWRELEFP